MARRCNWLILAFCLCLPGRLPAPILSGPIMRTIGSSSTLNTSLIAYWKLDETSGTRVDSEPSGTPQDLTDNNTVTSNTGIISNAAQFVAANSEYLSRTDSADLSGGNTDFTIATWVRLDTETANRVFVSKYGSTGNQREYLLRYTSASDRFEFIVSSDGTGVGLITATANTFGAVPAATFCLVVAWHDSVNNLIGIAVNGGGADTTATSAGVFDGTAGFGLGAADIGGTPVTFMDGRLDETAFWRKVLTSTERTELYDSGAGKTCCPF